MRKQYFSFSMSALADHIHETKLLHYLEKVTHLMSELLFNLSTALYNYVLSLPSLLPFYIYTQQCEQAKAYTTTTYTR